MFLPIGGNNYDNNFLPEGYGKGLPPVNVLYGNSKLEPTQFAVMNPYSSTEDSIPNSNYYARGGRVKRYKGGGIFGNPTKWFASNALPAIGAIAGNMIAPGIGGIIGGSIGGAANTAIRGRKDYGKATVRGAGMGAMLPSVASGAGSILQGVGAKGSGAALSQYGEANAIMPALDKMLGFSGGSKLAGASSGKQLNNLSALAILNGQGGKGALPTEGLGVAAGEEEAAVPDANKDFIGSLTAKSKNFLSEPSNLMTLGALGLSLANRQKEKSPEQLGAEDKRRHLAASLYTPEELARMEAQELELAQAKRRIGRNKFLPEERLGNIEQTYIKYNDPEEAKKRGKWVEYYGNPQFAGEPIYRKEGGEIPEVMEEEVVSYPSGSYILRGLTGGQEDVRPLRLPENSHIIDASTLSALGDGNTEAGAARLDAYLSDGEMIIPPEVVKKKGGGDVNKGHRKLKLLTKNARKHKYGSSKLPPKAKSIQQYIKGK